jgi:hypothetical protein
MKNLSYLNILKLTFPLVFAIIFWLFSLYILPIVPGIDIIPVLNIFYIFFILDLLFFAFLGYSQLLNLARIPFIAFIIGLIQWIYMKRLPESRIWQYILIIVVTYIQTGLVLAILFIIAYS